MKKKKKTIVKKLKMVKTEQISLMLDAYFDDDDGHLQKSLKRRAFQQWDVAVAVVAVVLKELALEEVV